MEYLGMKLLYGAVSGLLVWAAAADLRTGTVPRPAGWGVLLAGLVGLAAARLWWEAGLYLGLLALSGARGTLPVAGLLLGGALVVFRNPLSLPLVVGLGYTFLTFRLGWLGGGDAQLALGLVALARDWPMLAYLAGAALLLALAGMLARGGPMGALRRAVWVAGHLEAAERDPAALKLPWAVAAGLGGGLYLWLLPGLMWR